MQQILWNLLSNAVKFTPSGGVVQVDVRRDIDDVLIEVSDTGVGIRPELLPHVFDRFLQGDSGADRQSAGLGLGLAIAKQLVELHGGEISASSAGQGRGARFYIRMPLKAESIEEPDSAVSQDARAGLEGLRILLVEDEPGSREGTARLLQAQGAEVHAVESSAAAQEAFALRAPDIIVSDIGLAGEDGYVLLRTIRASEQQRGSARIPAVALTAFARKEDRQRAAEAGFDAHVSKPVDPQKLLLQIRVLTGRLE